MLAVTLRDFEWPPAGSPQTPNPTSHVIPAHYPPLPPRSLWLRPCWPDVRRALRNNQAPLVLRCRCYRHWFRHHRGGVLCFRGGLRRRNHQGKASLPEDCWPRYPSVVACLHRLLLLGGPAATCSKASCLRLDPFCRSLTPPESTSLIGTLRFPLSMPCVMTRTGTCELWLCFLRCCASVHACPVHRVGRAANLLGIPAPPTPDGHACAPLAADTLQTFGAEQSRWPPKPTLCLWQHCTAGEAPTWVLSISWLLHLPLLLPVGPPPDSKRALHTPLLVACPVQKFDPNRSPPSDPLWTQSGLPVRHAKRALPACWQPPWLQHQEPFTCRPAADAPSLLTCCAVC